MRKIAQGFSIKRPNMKFLETRSQSGKCSRWEDRTGLAWLVEWSCQGHWKTDSQVFSSKRERPEVVVIKCSFGTYSLWRVKPSQKECGDLKQSLTLINSSFILLYSSLNCNLTSRRTHNMIMYLKHWVSRSRAAGETCEHQRWFRSHASKMKNMMSVWFGRWEFLSHILDNILQEKFFPLREGGLVVRQLSHSRPGLL